MRGGALPPALLVAALAFALAFAPRRAWAPGLALLAVGALALVAMPIPADVRDVVFLGAWASIAATALSVHLPQGLTRTKGLAVSLNAGLWCGALAAVAGEPLDLVKAAPAALLLAPAAALAGRAPVAVKVAASWLVAVAVLCAALQALPVTPGYLPDHLD
jgi:hypothetical protein